MLMELSTAENILKNKLLIEKILLKAKIFHKFNGNKFLKYDRALKKLEWFIKTSFCDFGMKKYFENCIVLGQNVSFIHNLWMTPEKRKSQVDLMSEIAIYVREKS